MAHIGIDLGTTNSVVAYPDEDEKDVSVIENSSTGENTTPSAVLIEHDEDGAKDVTVGAQALRRRVTETEKIVTRAKDYMGVIEDGEAVTLTGDGEELRPEEISSYVLEYLVEDAKRRVDEVDGAVITVPYYFDEKAREATRKAAEIADLEVDRLLNEPTAATTAYRYQNKEFTGTLLVYDLGGGTFDATLVDVEENVTVVRGTHGRDKLGGETFDDKLYDYVVDEIRDQGLTDPDENPALEQQIRGAVVTAKEDFSNMSSTNINELIDGEQFTMDIEQDDFRSVIDEDVEETLTALEDLFEDDEVDASPDDVDEVLLVGGSTRIPYVQEKVEGFFGMEVDQSVNPDEAVAVGAALEAINYDEAIDSDAFWGGMALPGATGGGTIDVLSHSLGVAAYEEGADPEEDPLMFDPILKRNMEVPGSSSKQYQTARDNQTTIEAPILQGEGELAADDENEELAELQLTDIEPRPAGEAKIEVTFTVDEEGILSAEAEDLQSGKKVDLELDDALDLGEIEEEVDRGEIQRPADD